MKSEKAKEILSASSITDSCGYEYLLMSCAEKAVELAEQEAEERMRAKAIEAFCAANCPKGCSFGADGNIGCVAKARFIQKLSEE